VTITTFPCTRFIFSVPLSRKLMEDHRMKVKKS